MRNPVVDEVLFVLKNDCAIFCTIEQLPLATSGKRFQYKCIANKTSPENWLEMDG